MLYPQDPVLKKIQQYYPIFETRFIFKFQFLFLTKSHVSPYPCPNNIKYLRNIGFLHGICIVLQSITGMLFSLNYTPNIHYSYYCIMYIIRAVYYGRSLRYSHSNGAPFLYTVLFIRIGRVK